MTNPGALDGLLAFPVTAFDDDLELAPSAFAEHVEAHLAAGAGAVFVACGTGEFSALAPEEVRSVLRTAREVVRGRVPVWVGAGGGPKQARAGVALAESEGADGVLLLPPYLVSGPSRGLVDHVRYAVGDSTVPVVVYHRAPGVFTVDSALALLGIPSVVGVKDGYGDVDLMNRIVTAVRSTGTRRAEDFLFFNGLPTAEVSAQAYAAIGVARYSSAVHCFVPEIAAAFHRALTGEVFATDRARRLLTEFYLPLVRLRDETPGFAVSLVKAGARLRGQRVGRVRPPLVDPTDDQLVRLGGIIDRGTAALREIQECG